ncbi:hypothetical protein [Pedobacter sp. V48]|uniref:hypothetical protein n=1 Tax=Pedobacter sp. V48 TaxID=509635 RepID=UPI0003E5235E|nr:hypothetical protein [Pedobacter sp. V48]ETZ20208.1 hypothetical protein N824_08320 [Pedobacter sp. V48]
MKTVIGLLLILFACCQLNAQIKVPVKIDTTQRKNLALYQFLNTYMQQDTISKEMWHPKYKDKKVYNYTMDWIWSAYTPKQITERFELELSELQNINDTLSYVKILAKARPEKIEDDYTNVYKFYIVRTGNKFYLDNCKDYDVQRFKKYTTRNLVFYVSPFYTVDEKKLHQASEQVDSLYAKLKQPPLIRPIAYYMCSSEEELNNLSNIVIWNGGLTGYTNIPEGYVVAINDNPSYKHEFVHAILRSSANCFFMQEGIATLYGGTNKGQTSYEMGLAELKACYKTGKCTFDNLYERKVEQQYNSSLTYTFAAVFCKYLIDNYGLEYFYKLYYNREITSSNFIKKVSEITGKSQDKIKEGVEVIILQ